MDDRLKILFVSSEVEPFAKTGGLADVAGSLPRAIKNMGHDIRVVMPEYSQIPEKYLLSLEHVLHFRTMVGWRNEYVGINKLNFEGVPTYFVDNKYFFARESLYENDDRHVQFIFFCRAVLDMLPRIDFKPDIIHFNDWQTGPLSLMLKDNYKHLDFYKDIKTVFTIHNLRYQGVFGREILEDAIGVSTHYWDDGTIRHDGLINFMKTGIMTADAVTTVSETYAEEIKDPYFGEGLDYAIRMRGDNLYGIVNGISYEDFNPAIDSRIYANYDKDHLEGKYENKAKLQELMGLPQRQDVPVIGIISRLVEQKGFDLIIHILDELLKEDIQIVLLGTGDPRYENIFIEAAGRYPEKMSANIKYDAELAQKIYAGSDIFLMPSKFEPCGLSQLISLRYGTIPVVRETGGLKDTIKPYDEETGEGNGFTFTNYNAHEMLSAINKAIEFFYQPEKWEKLVKRGMELDYSWRNSAGKYLDLYADLTGKERVKDDVEYKEDIIEDNVADEAQKSLSIEREEAAANDKINLNNATIKELKQLQGIGPSLARRIIKYRDEQGEFNQPEDLMKVKGISDKKYKSIAKDITL